MSIDLYKLHILGIRQTMDVMNMIDIIDLLYTIKDGALNFPTTYVRVNFCRSLLGKMAENKGFLPFLQTLLKDTRHDEHNRLANIAECFINLTSNEVIALSEEYSDYLKVIKGFLLKHYTQCYSGTCTGSEGLPHAGSFCVHSQTDERKNGHYMSPTQESPCSDKRFIHLVDGKTNYMMYWSCCGPVQRHDKIRCYHYLTKWFNQPFPLYATQ